MVGQHDVIDGVMTALLAGGHVLLEGVPGLGKTMLVRCLSAAIETKFSRIQFTPDMMPADIQGTWVLMENDQGRHELRFQEGPLIANLILADEINRATPKTQSALLEAMQERQVTVGKRTIKLSEPFCVLATQNPVEQEGTYPLPEAQLDRFLLKLVVGYPKEEEYGPILDRTIGDTEVTIAPVTNAAEIVQLRHVVRAVPVPDARAAVRHPHRDGHAARQPVRAEVRQRIRGARVESARRPVIAAGGQSARARRRPLRRERRRREAGGAAGACAIGC